MCPASGHFRAEATLQTLRTSLWVKGWQSGRGPPPLLEFCGGTSQGQAPRDGPPARPTAPAVPLGSCYGGKPLAVVAVDGLGGGGAWLCLGDSFVGRVG